MAESNRPKPVSELEKARILASLPEEGEITDLDAPSLRKLASLKPLLLATGRASAYEIKVVDAPQARIVLYAPTVILISKTGLALLGAEELRAQVAHEIGHEYLWVDHARASAREHSRRLKELELLCDAIAIILLHELELDPSPLVTGIDRVTRHNLKVYGAAVDERNYPTLSERRAFARAVTAWVARAGSPRSSR